MDKKELEKFPLGTKFLYTHKGYKDEVSLEEKTKEFIVLHNKEFDLYVDNLKVDLKKIGG